jgi:hypothetical protein
MRYTSIAAGIAVACLCIAFPSWAQKDPGSSETPIVGTWLLVKISAVRPDGTKEVPYGKGEGIMMFDATGRYSTQFCSLGRAKFASNNRVKGTPEEYRATAEGCNTHWGRYSVTDSRTLTLSIENASFPNWIGIQQRRSLDIVGDQLTYTTPGSAGGMAVAIWERAKSVP